MNRNAILLITSNFVSNFGTYLTYMGAALYVFEKTKSNFAVGATFFLVLAANIVAGPVAVKYGDMWRKRRVLIFCDLSSTALVLIWSFFSHSMIVGYAAIFLKSILANIHNPLQQSLIPFISSKKEYDTVNTLVSMSIPINMIVGFTCGALLLNYLGMSLLLKIDSMTFLLSALIIYSISVQEDNLKKVMKRFSRSSLRSLIKEVRSTHTLELIFIPSILFQAVFGANRALAIGYARSSFNAGITGAGFMEVWFAVGFLIGGYFTTRICKKVPDEIIFLTAGFLLIANAMLFGAAPNYTVAVIARFISGFMNVFVVVKWRSFVQKRVAMEFQARTFSLIFSVVLTAQMTAMVCSSLLADAYSPHIILFIFGAVSTVVLTIYYVWLWRRYYSDNRLQHDSYVAQEK